MLFSSPTAMANDLSAFGAYVPRGLVARILSRTRRCTEAWRSKRLSFLLRGVAVRVLRGRPLDVVSFGARMRLYPYNNVAEKRILFTPQYFDEAERRLLRECLRDDFVFIDIGANIGGYTLFAAALAGPRARILAIEPQPEIFERLVYNMRQNAFGNMKALDCAVADCDGEIVLFVNTQNRGKTSMRTVHSDANGPQIRVPAKTLQTIVEEEGFAHIDVIKIDVMGAEDLILEPFFEALPPKLWPRLLVMERNGEHWATDLDGFLKQRGYSEVLRTRINIVYKAAAPHEATQEDRAALLARAAAAI